MGESGSVRGEGKGRAKAVSELSMLSSEDVILCVIL